MGDDPYSFDNDCVFEQRSWRGFLCPLQSELFDVKRTGFTPQHDTVVANFDPEIADTPARADGDCFHYDLGQARRRGAHPSCVS